jgi:hypothetical protein
MPGGEFSLPVFYLEVRELALVFIGRGMPRLLLRREFAGQKAGKSQEGSGAQAPRPGKPGCNKAAASRRSSFRRLP